MNVVMKWLARDFALSYLNALSGKRSVTSLLGASVTITKVFVGSLETLKAFWFYV